MVQFAIELGSLWKLSMTTKLKRSVLQLYALCLHSARRCPQWEQREMMKAYVKMKLRDEMKTLNPDRVRTLLADGWEELERMNYYHSIYEAKQNERKSSVQGSNSTIVSERQRQSSCSQCQAAFSSEQANYCAHCGTKRKTSFSQFEKVITEFTVWWIDACNSMHVICQSRQNGDCGG